jgi:hypothetical protein
MTGADWSLLAGMRCTCPPGCTTGSTWGDGPRECDIECRPCSIMAGRRYTPPGGALTERTAVCEVCCAEFPARRSARFCSDRCRQRHHRHPDRLPNCADDTVLALEGLVP